MISRDEALAAAASLEEAVTAAARTEGASWSTDVIRHAECAAAAVI